MKNKSSAKLLTVFLALLLCFSIIVPTLAWFAEHIVANFPTVGASTAVSYFDSGDGSEDQPYIISHPLHLYNLAWLQYIGYFNLGSTNNGRSQSYFKLSTNIDMTGLTLPPIGTTEYPFLGSFDGNGKVISNLTVANSNDALARRPSNAKFEAVNSLLSNFTGGSTEAGAVMGFFGVVGDYNGAAAALEARDPAFDESIIIVKNTALTAYTIENDSSASAVGFIAGYVNAQLENMLANNCTMRTASDAVGIASLSSNISDHLLVGYCTAEFADSLDARVVDISDPAFDSFRDINGAEGYDTTWGESVSMDTLYTDLSDIRDEENTPLTDYAYEAVKLISTDGESYCSVDRETITSIMYSDKFNMKDYYSVTYSYDNRLTVTEIMMLGGGAMVSSVKCAETSTVLNALFIKYGDEYLSLRLGGGAPTLTLVESESDAAKWVITSAGELFVIVDGCKLYVNVEAQNLIFSMSPKVTSWSWVEDKGLCYTSNGTDYYLQLDEGKWQLREEGSGSSKYYIKSGNNYLIDTGVKPSENHPYFTVENLTTDDPADPDITVWNISEYELDNFKLYRVASENGYLLFYGDFQVHGQEAVNEGRWELETGSDGLSLYLYRSGYGYLTFSNGAWGMTQTAAEAVALTPVSSGSAEDSRSFTSSATSVTDLSYTNPAGINFEFDVANEHDATYIPLQQNENNSPSRKNTGYITSGMYNQLKPDALGDVIIPQPNEGDVRASEFYSANISNKNSVYVWNSATSSFQAISTDTSRFTENSLGATLKKYETSVVSYKALLEQTRLYGLQFVDGIISKDSLITVPHAIINDKDIENYQLPADCIDFMLKQSGYINFFAGTYYPGTNCFFSLHHIKRDANNNISEILEIELIYENPDTSSSGKYVYKYTDGSYSQEGFSSADAVIVFNTAWLTSPDGIITPAADTPITTETIPTLRGESYYFEIPVDAGEYALGSVNGKTGACLLYLDIGSVPQDDAPTNVDRTVIKEVITESSNSYEYAKGVGIMDGEGYSPLGEEYVSFTLPAGYGTSIAVNRTGSKISVTPSSASSNFRLNSIGGGITVVKLVPDEVSMTPSPASNSEVIVTKRYSIYDIDHTNGTDTTVVVSFRDANSNGTIDTGEVTITDGAGNDLSSTITLTHTSTKTSFTLPTRPLGDEIDWESFTASETPVLSYNYSVSQGNAVTNSAVYDRVGKSYAVSFTATEPTDMTVTAVNTSDNLNAVYINGSSTAAKAGDVITASTTE